MAALDDIKEKLKSTFHGVSERVQETSAFQSARDRYGSLSPAAQKSTLILSALLIFLAIVAVPLTSFLNSLDSVNQFEARRDLIHDLYRATSEIQNATGLQAPPPITSLQSRIESELKNNMLLPDQIRAVQLDAPPGSLPKDAIAGSLMVSLAKLNLRQIVDIGSLLQGLGNAIKVVDMDLRSDSEDPRYYDVIYKLVALNVPSLPPPELDTEPSKTKGSKNSGKKAGADE